MNATELLKQDHRKAMAMIEELENEKSGTELRGPNLELFGRLKATLTLHTFIEEQIFYHSLANLPETRDLIKKAYEQHRKVDHLLVKMTTAKDWKPLLGELKSEIQDHVNEEEGELFPNAERLVAKNRLMAMGREMENIKQGKAAIA